MAGHIIRASAGEWLRPLGSMESLLAVGGKYGSLNTVQAIWLSSKRPIDAEVVKNAVLQVAEKNEVFQVCVQLRGMRPWFKRMNDFAFDFEVVEEDVLSVFNASLQKAYDMTKGPLWGVRFVPIAHMCIKDDCHKAALILMAHHSITDGHTNMAFFRDTLEVLNAFMTDRIYNVPLRPVISAVSDSLMPKDWSYLFMYCWSKVTNTMIRNYNNKVYFRGALLQPKTKVAVTKLLRSSFTVEETKALIHHCRAAGVTVHSCIMAAANLALLKTVKQKAKYEVDAAKINSVTLVNMRRYFPLELKESAGCHISTEENEMLIPFSATQSKEQFWSLVKIFQKNLDDSLNVHYTPIKNTPLFRLGTMLLRTNYELTRRGHKNKAGNHMFSTNMGNLQNILPGKYKGPVKITDILRSTSSEVSGHPFSLTFHTFMDKFMISVDYFTNKITDDVARQFFSDLISYIGNIAKYGTVHEHSKTTNEANGADYTQAALSAKL